MPFLLASMCLLVAITAFADSDKSTNSSMGNSFTEAANKCKAELSKNHCPVDIVPFCQSAEKLAKQTLGYAHLTTAQMMYNLGECLVHRERFTQAAELTKQSIEIRIQILGKQHLLVADGINNLGAIMFQQGNIQRSSELINEALLIRTGLLGKDNLAVIESWNNLATILGMLGEFNKAEAILREQIEVATKTFGREALLIAMLVNNLADKLDRLGRVREAEESIRYALTIRKKHLPDNHPDVVLAHYNLASLLANVGKYHEAETLYRKLISIKTEQGETKDLSFAHLLNNLADVIELQGNHAMAENLHKEALEIKKIIFGYNVNHIELAISLNNIGNVLVSQNRLDEAEVLHRQSCNMRENLFGSKHPSVALCIHNLAGVIEAQKKLSEAEILYRKALLLRKQRYDQTPRDIAATKNRLASVLDASYRLEEAESLHEQVIEYYRQSNLNAHPNMAQALIGLGRNQLLQRRQRRALSLFKNSIEIFDDLVRNVVSETRLRSLLDLPEFRFDHMIYGTLLGGDSQAADLAFRLAVLQKGRVLDIGIWGNHFTHRNIENHTIKAEFREWIKLRQTYESAIFFDFQKVDSFEYQQRLERLKLQIEEQEYKVATLMPTSLSFHPPRFAFIKEKIGDSLHSDSLLIEIVQGTPMNAEKPTQPQWEPLHYIALLLFSDKSIMSLDLGETSRVDDLVSGFAKVLSRPLSDPKPAAKALYDQIFTKLAPYLKGRTDVYLSLDGSLHLIPFDALHDGTDYLLGRYKFHYLTSGRDLLRKPSSQPVGSALVIGNPYFGRSANAENEAGSSVYHRLTNLSDLPWAQREAESVAKLLGVRAVTGASAKEELLRDRLAPSVVHLATHGLFLTDVAAPMSLGTRSSLLLASPPEEMKPASTEPPLSLPGLFGPMNRAALVFANARQGATVEDKSKDGLLTAEEARSLDLDGTQLVVLSACETGQGETSSGQGVYGLRRAFLSAGAETVVTSLWRVHDEATGELMTKYYGKLLDKQHPGDRLGAMIESMQELRARPGREHPYYWAPFLVIGADGPLRHTAMR